MTIFAQLIGFGSIPTARCGMTMSLAQAPALHGIFNITQPLVSKEGSIPVALALVRVFYKYSGATPTTHGIVGLPQQKPG